MCRRAAVEADLLTFLYRLRLALARLITASSGMAATNPKEPVMPAPTATATLAKVGTNLVLTVTHSVLTETASVSGVVKSGLGAEGTFEGTATFPGSVTVNADGRTWTKDAAASDATKTVFTAPF